MPPPSAYADAVCEVLHTVVNRLQTQHPQALLLISGDSSRVCPSANLPTFTQYVMCHPRDSNILDLFYANTSEAYTSLYLPLLGRSVHNLVHLLPVYKPLVHGQPAVTCMVRKWTDGSYEALRECFKSTVWEELWGAHREDIDSLTDTIMDYISLCVDNTVPTRTAQCFSDSQPWKNLDIKALLKQKKRAFKISRQ